jgi:hypothetical protein
MTLLKIIVSVELQEMTEMKTALDYINKTGNSGANGWP